MKRLKFSNRDGLLMLLGLFLTFAAMMWLMLSGILQIND